MVDNDIKGANKTKVELITMKRKKSNFLLT
jgi:hypothetical protein